MPDIDYTRIFRVFPGPAVLVSRDLRILDANQDFLDVVNQPREIVGQDFFAAFRGRWDNSDNARDQLRESLESVAATGETDKIPMLRYDTEQPGRPGVFDDRYWSVIWMAAQTGPDGKPTVILGRAEDITPLVREAHRAQAVSG